QRAAWQVHEQVLIEEHDELLGGPAHHVIRLIRLCGVPVTHDRPAPWNAVSCEASHADCDCAWASACSSAAKRRTRLARLSSNRDSRLAIRFSMPGTRRAAAWASTPRSPAISTWLP